MEVILVISSLLSFLVAIMYLGHIYFLYKEHRKSKEVIDLVNLIFDAVFLGNLIKGVLAILFGVILIVVIFKL
jgi:hypothetical protein